MGWGVVSEYPGRPIFTFFIKENWICAMTRHHVELNIIILLTRNVPFDRRQTMKPSFNDTIALFVY